MERTRRLCALAAIVALPLALSACRNAPAERAGAATPAAAPTTTKAAVAPAHGDPVWHYEGPEGPEHWGELSPTFATCSEGHSQSPVDIDNPATATETLQVKTNLLPGTLRIAHHEHIADGINNGHTIQITYAGADDLTIGRDTYGLVQYHFHHRSEHTVHGKHYPMEMHLVHKGNGGKLAVVAVFIEEGAHNKAFDPIWNNLPKQRGVETHYPSVHVDVDKLLPRNRTSYRYDGSLTTPPCSEGVRWIVLKTPIQLSKAQIRAFTAIIHDNSRPTQPLYGRPVLVEPLELTE